MVVFESLIDDPHRFVVERPAPVTLRSSDGYVHVVNGPRNYALCEGYPCLHRPAAYYAVIKAGKKTISFVFYLTYYVSCFFLGGRVVGFTHNFFSNNLPTYDKSSMIELCIIILFTMDIMTDDKQW